RATLLKRSWGFDAPASSQPSRALDEGAWTTVCAGGRRSGRGRGAGGARRPPRGPPGALTTRLTSAKGLVLLIRLLPGGPRPFHMTSSAGIMAGGEGHHERIGVRRFFHLCIDVDRRALGCRGARRSGRVGESG